MQALGVPGNSNFVPSGVIDATGFTARAYVSMDARTASAFGTVRTNVVIRGQTGTGIQSGGDNYATNAITGQAGATAITVEQAIVQFAGFTFGRTTRDMFSFMPSPPLGSYSKSGYAGALNILSYQANFGGGFSGAIGLEDRASQSSSNAPGYIAFGPGGTVVPAGVFNNAAASTANQVGAAVTNGPMTLPALGANLRYDGSWGAVQAMGVVQQNAAATNLLPGSSPNLKLTKTGYALGLGVKINLPMLAAGDALYATAAYADGDMVQLTSFGTSAVTSGFGREVPGLLRVDRDLYVTPSANQAGCALATMTSNCFRTESPTGWSTAVYFNHFWTPTIQQWLMFSYLSITPGVQTRNTDWTLGGLASAQLLRVGTMLQWSPIKDLDFSTEVGYVKMTQKFSATSIANGGTGIASCQPGGPGFGAAACNALKGTAAGGDVWEGRVRAERRF